MNCPHCGTPRFRSSRLSFTDLPRLAMLQVPVRCLLCRERFHIGIFLAFRLRGSEPLRSSDRLQQPIR